MQENDLLLQHLKKLKTVVSQKEILINNSLGQHNEFTYRAKIEKVKFLFLLKEARYRKVGLK